MIKIYQDLLSLLLPSERRLFYTLLAVAAVSAFLEATSVASILPLLSVLADPGLITENMLLARLHKFTGEPSVERFQFMLALGTFVFVVGGLALKMFTLYAISRFSAMRSFTVATRLLERYLHQPYEFFLQQHSADINRTLQVEVNRMVVTVLQPCLLLASSFLVVFFLTGLLFLTEPIVAAVVGTVLTLCYAGIYFSVRTLVRRLGRDRVEANEQRFRLTQETMEGAKYIKLRGLEKSYISRFRFAARKMARADSWALVLRSLPRHFLEIIGFGGMLLYILVSISQSAGQIATLVPTLGLVAFAGLRLLPSLQTIFTIFTGLREGEAALEVVMKQFKASALASRIDDDGPFDSFKLREGLELRDVSYTYPSGERAAVHGLTMYVPRHSSIGVVGGTGSGKTTTIDLILGLLVPHSGEIRVDGVVIDESNRKSWQRSLGYVPQSIYLTADSLAANIAFGLPREDIDIDRVVNAARMAALDDFVLSELPDGYDTQLGEHGIRLSGGQRQRVGIARALYFDPEVLIFDEATSALDNITERTVMKAIDRLGGQKTIIMIAHRLSTVRNCDNIFLLEHGQVSASGTFAELSQASSTFMEMVRPTEN